MRGISPLIAIILLVAFVVIIGMIIFGWGSDFFKFIMRLVTEKSGQSLLCTNGKINFLIVGFSGNNISGKIANIGATNLSEIRISFLYSNGMEVIELCGNSETVRCEASNLTLPGGGVVSFEIQPTYKPKTIYVLTNCPEVNDRVEFDDICLKNLEKCSSSWHCCSDCKTDWDEDPEPPAGWCCYASQCTHDGICYNQFAVCKVGLGCYEQDDIPPGLTKPYYRCEEGEWRLII